MLTRREFAAGAAAGILSGAVPSRPNIVFVCTDDQRWDTLGCTGHPFIRTPNIDRLALEGALFRNSFCTTPLCSPSRASFLTGRYVHAHGVLDNEERGILSHRFVTWPRLLHDAGYETAFMGKWHMGHESDEPRPGFDKWVSFRGQGEYYNTVLNIDGKKVKSTRHISDELTDYAVEWLKQERNKPFFLYLSHKAVHAMFAPAKRHLGKYENVTLEYPASMADTEENYRGKPAWVKEQRNSWHGVDYMYHGQMDFDTFYKRYCETLLSVDDSIGRVLDCLKEIGQAESTLVFYMGDNGFCFGEHGLIDKRHMYEPSMRVPLLAYCPELIRRGTKATQLVQNIDIAPTILEAAGAQPPEHMDGRSLLSLLEGKDITWRDSVFYEYYWEAAFPQTPTTFGVRTDRYKFIHYHGIWDTDELYDMQNDPDEMHNLIDGPEHRQLVADLRKRLYDWLDRTGGMQIPLRREAGGRSDKRGPQQVKQYEYYGQSK